MIIVLRLNKLVVNVNKLVSDLDIDANTHDSLEGKDSKFIYPSAGQVVTGNLKIIPDSRIRNIVSKYRFFHISTSTYVGKKLHLQCYVFKLLSDNLLGNSCCSLGLPYVLFCILTF